MADSKHTNGNNPNPAFDESVVKANLDRQFSQFTDRLNQTAARFEELVGQASSAIIDQTETLARVAQSPSTVSGDADLAGTGDIADRLRQLEGRCQQLQKSRDTAEAVIQARTRVLQAVSQDVRIYLQDLVSLLGPLRSNRKLDPRERSALSATESGITSLLTQMDMLRDLPAIADGTLELGSIVFDLHQLLKEAVGVLAPLAASKGIELGFNINNVPSRLVGDPVRVWQVLCYTATQAIRLAAKGVVTIHISQKHKTDVGTVVRFAIDNAGTGMPQEQLDNLCEWEAFGGNGDVNDPMVHFADGLARCGHLLRTMGGQIGVESAASRGFAIWFTAALERPSGEHDQRHTRRQLQEMLHCNLGPIVDLSTGGIKVLCRKLPKRNIAVIIIDSMVRVKVKAEVVWSRNLGPRNYEAGLRFLDITDEQVQQLRQITAKHGFSRLHGDD